MQKASKFQLSLATIANYAGEDDVKFDSSDIPINNPAELLQGVTELETELKDFLQKNPADTTI